MSQGYNVVIVSCFGRGHWLASACAEKGGKVALVDVSSSLGRWTPEDWEGPFGFFQDSNFSASQTERLFADDYHETVDEGLVVWLKNGPCDLKGPLASFWQEQLNITPEMNEYISNYHQMSPEERQNALKKISNLPFSDTWFLHLVHQIASPVMAENSEAIKHGSPLSVFSPLHIRRSSRRGFEKSLSWCEEKGVKVFRNSSIGDLQYEKDVLTAVEVQGDNSEVVRGDNFVWSLTSEETKFVTSKSSELFPAGVVESEWNWMRFRVQVDESPAVEILPIKFMVIDDIYLPWTHENLCLVEKTVQKEYLDVWTRVPTHQRFHKSYLEDIQSKLVQTLNQKIPDANVKGIDFPQDYHYDYQQLGPSRLPVFNQAALKGLKRKAIKNLNFDGPEVWRNLDWGGQIKSQSKILNNLQFKQGESVDHTLHS